MEVKHFESLYPLDTRFSEIAAVLRFIQEGKSSQVLSTPGGGRSNFFGLLSYNKLIRQHHLKDQEKWLHFVLMDFSQVQEGSLLEVYKLMFLELIDSLEQRELKEEHEQIKHLFADVLPSQDTLVLFQGLKKAIEFLTLEKQLTIIFLFDKFEAYLPQITAEFFRNLHVLRDKAKYRFSVCFSLHKALEDITEPELIKDFSEFFSRNTVYLTLYDKAGIDFRISYIEKLANTQLSSDVKETIIQQTGGHPKLTRLCIETALEKTVIPDLIGDLDSRFRGNDKLLKQKSVQKALEDIWQSLNPAEQTHFLKELYPRVLDDEHSQYLKAIGLMTENAFTIPLFTAFITAKKTIQKEMTDTLSYNPTMQMIMKGDSEISDKLTATEFKLLVFFLQNQNTILERNTIISGVWKENKTVLGVSDQALDQLIFRLRKKIEEDPNNPTHIQTIKGRGFKFSA